MSGRHALLALAPAAALAALLCLLMWWASMPDELPSAPRCLVAVLGGYGGQAYAPCPERPWFLPTP